jgi:hypothetical protein
MQELSAIVSMVVGILTAIYTAGKLLEMGYKGYCFLQENFFKKPKAK